MDALHILIKQSMACRLVLQRLQAVKLVWMCCTWSRLIYMSVGQALAACVVELSD